ncbi:hypothetical protein [Bacillus wiedmannii]|uniref:hypothetical protein n=1 Tax=Bacillus wiedmannii TaxID=1890302 RepID=UPI0007DB068F|nr:hypothetical protein [Bacillus wiedmannii]OAK22897.1 hypothetical protein A6281_01255 [Bacillus wiedmannii]OAK24954.1 hypothetical protein A6282_02255 [Bacillus wiedmannii]
MVTLNEILEIPQGEHEYRYPITMRTNGTEEYTYTIEVKNKIDESVLLEKLITYFEKEENKEKFVNLEKGKAVKIAYIMAVDVQYSPLPF